MRTVNVPELPSNYCSFRHQRDQRALVGVWSARVLLSSSQSPEIGQGWEIPGIMVGGILTQAVLKGQEPGGERRKLWELSGYDGGFRLMQSPTLAHQLKKSDLGGVIEELAEICGVSADVTIAGQLPVDARYLVSGQTAANAIIDLAILGGAVTHMIPEGSGGKPLLKVAPPRGCNELGVSSWQMDDPESKNLDLDGYASGVVVILGMRGKATDAPGSDPKEEDPTGDGDWWVGSTPDGMLRRVSKSGYTRLPGGGLLSWQYVILQPIGVIESYEAQVFFPGLGMQKTVLSEYTYEAKTAVVQQGNQEFRWWWFALLEAKEVEVSFTDAVYYDASTGGTATERVERSIERTLEREYDLEFSHILREVSEIRSYDSGAATPLKREGYDQRTEKAYTWDDDNGYRGLAERAWTFEERDAGKVDMVYAPDGTPATITAGEDVRYTIMPAHQTTVFVKREVLRQVDEALDDEGNVAVRIERETDDEGVNDMLARGLFGDIMDPSNQNAKIALAWLRSLPQRGRLEVRQAPGSSSLSTEIAFLSQPGRRYKAANTSSGLGDSRYYESLSGVTSGARCPFLCSNNTCGVISTPSSAGTASGGSSGGSWSGGGVGRPGGSTPDWSSTYEDYESTEPSRQSCLKYDEDTQSTPDYEDCSRYRAFRHLAGQVSGPAPCAPAIGIAGGGSVWTEKEVFVNEELKEDHARLVAQKMAENVLAVKTVSRGLVETYSIPLNLKYHPDGAILAVEHDWENLRTHLTFRPSSGTPPEYLMLLSTSSTAANVFAKESVSKGRSAIGRVIDVRPDRALCIVGGRPVSCSAPVRITRGDNVLVFLPPGSVANGIVQAVMR